MRPDTTIRVLKFFGLALLGSWLATAQTLIQAELWPAKPIRLIVPFPTGGTSDILARMIHAGQNVRGASRWEGHD